MRGAVSFAILLSVLGKCASKPVLELPREMTMDVNKPPFPIVNVISERASPASSATNAHGEARAETVAIAKTSSGERASENSAFATLLTEQHARLERLKSLRTTLR